MRQKQKSNRNCLPLSHMFGQSPCSINERILIFVKYTNFVDKVSCFRQIKKTGKHLYLQKQRFTFSQIMNDCASEISLKRKLFLCFRLTTIRAVTFSFIFIIISFSIHYYSYSYDYLYFLHEQNYIASFSQLVVMPQEHKLFCNIDQTSRWNFQKKKIVA